MQKVIQRLMIALFLLSVNQLIAQIDDFKSQEFRFSIVGTEEFNINWDDRIIDNNEYFDPTFYYLKRIKETPYYLKTGIRAGFIQKPRIYEISESEPNIYMKKHFIGKEGYKGHLLLSTGIERQMKFKHWGVFFSVSGFGGNHFYSGDIDFEENPIRDLRYQYFIFGAEGMATLYTNITDKIYFYLDVSNRFFYAFENIDITGNPNYPVNNEGIDFNTNLLESVGLAYKF